ncbi:hypothetical protein F441_18546 [Phytophthora nicotianae CJ01A1]|uniref:Uncharacterized protein n=1 Tax=Phytophthora nicotianae CJ01A1 TaxID=1317063 RepID=W2W2I1_PHYNI|nr:hypothetical protein F441_18546 [Phytophthora nicotianae CJ01A1]
MQLDQLFGGAGSADHVAARVTVHSIRQDLERLVALFAALGREFGHPLGLHHKRPRIQILASEVRAQTREVIAKPFHQQASSEAWSPAARFYPNHIHDLGVALVIATCRRRSSA